MRKIILDTDIGSDIDDAFCLTYLLKKTECDLLGITTVSGEPVKRAEIADAILKHNGKKVPIYPGIANPLIVESRQPVARQYSKINNWKHDTSFKECEAISFLKNTIEANPGEITLLPVGPLTNIAVLFTEYPHIPGLLKDMVIMGGRFYFDSLEQKKGEWNIYCDPHAAHIVLNADVKTTLIGLDVTTKVFLSSDEAREKCSGDVLKPVMDFAEVWFERCNGTTFHDPLAATVIFNPDICIYDTKTACVNIDTSVTEISEGSKHLIAKSVNPEAFFTEYFSTVNG